MNNTDRQKKLNVERSKTVKTPEGDVEVSLTEDMRGNKRVALHVRIPFVAELAPSKVRELIEALKRYDARAQQLNAERRST